MTAIYSFSKIHSCGLFSPLFLGLVPPLMPPFEMRLAKFVGGKLKIDVALKRRIEIMALAVSGVACASSDAATCAK